MESYRGGDKRHNRAVAAEENDGRSTVIEDGVRWSGGAEIVNADAVQMYEKLDICSAKATVEEQRGVPHHLLSVLPLTTRAREFTVRDYTKRAIRVIEEVRLLRIVIF